MNMIHALIFTAMFLSGYGPPKDLVIVNYVTPEEMSDIACAGREPCNVLGFVARKNPDVLNILTNNSMTTTQQKAVVVHELVHILQHDYNPLMSLPGLPAWCKVEEEAYHVSNAFLMQNNSMPVPIPRVCRQLIYQEKTHGD